MSIVTVPGGNGVIIAIPFTSGDNVAAATALLQGLYYASPPSVHIAYTSSGTGAYNAVPGDVNELIDNVPGQIAVPNGYQYLVSDYRSNLANPYPVNSFIAGGTLDGAILDSEATTLSFEAGTGPTTVIAGGNIAITTRVTGGGSGEVLLDGNGTENVSLASGNWSVVTGYGPGSVSLGSGNDTVVANGTDTIYGGAGPAVVTFNNGNEMYQGGTGDATIVDNGTANTVYGGAGRETVFAQNSGLHVQGGGAEVLFVDLTGGDTVTAGAGGAVVFGTTIGSHYQTGGSYFFFTSGGGSDTISAAAGAQGPIVFGSPNGEVQITGAAQGTFVVAGGGNETINASALAAGVTFFAGSGNSDLIGGNGANFFAASTGNTTMTGGSSNLYQFINGHEGATNTITDFTPNDLLYLTQFGLGSTAGIVTETELNGQLNMILGDGTRIIFQNITDPSQLDGHIYHI